MTTQRGLGCALVALLSGCGGCGSMMEDDAGVPVVDAGALPQIQAFFASPASVPSDGGVSQLIFNVTGATSASIAPGVGDVTGKMNAPVTVLANTTFTLTATNATGSVTATTAVTVEPAPVLPPEIAFFTATPPMVPADGGTTTLAWSVTGADTLVIDRGVGSVTGRTSVDVGLRLSTIYTLEARGPGGMTSRSVTVLAVAPTVCQPATVLADGGAEFVTGASLGAGRSLFAWSTRAGSFASLFDGGTLSASSSFSTRAQAATSVARAGNNAVALAFVAEDGDAVMIDGLSGVPLASTTFGGGSPRVSGNDLGAFAWATNSSDVRSSDAATSSWVTLPPLTGDPVTRLRIATSVNGHVVATRVTSGGLTIAYKNATGWEPAFEYRLGFETRFPFDYETAVLSNGDLLVLWQDRAVDLRTWLQRYRRAAARFDLPQLLHTVPMATPIGQLKLLIDRQDRVTALHAARVAGMSPTLFASRDFGVVMQPAVPIADVLFVASDLDLDTGTIAVAFASPAVVRWTTATSQTWQGPISTTLVNRNSSESLAIAVGRDQHVHLAYVTSNGEVRANDCFSSDPFDAGPPFVPDAGAPVDAGTPNFVFSITSGVSRPLAGAYALLVGPTMRSTIISNLSGEFSVAWPLSERPFDLTVVAAGHEAVSILGITNELPTKVRIDPTSSVLDTFPISGTITGKSSPANRVELDLVDGVTPMPVTGSSWAARYRTTSMQPITVVAIEFNSLGNEVNWTKGTVARPDGGAVTLDLAFPSMPGTFQATTHTFVTADAGLFSGNALMASQSLGLVAHYVDLTPGAEAFVQSGVVSRSGATLTGIGIVDALAPNRMRHSIPTGGPFFVTQWMTDPFATSMSTAVLPELTRLQTTGSSLATVGANAQSPDFDTLELQISSMETTYWRVYSAPGAPFTVRLPDLPAGFHPATMMPGRSTVSVLALLIKFEAPTTRGWLLQGGDRSLVPYRLTVANSYRSVPTTWR